MRYKWASICFVSLCLCACVYCLNSPIAYTVWSTIRPKLADRLIHMVDYFNAHRKCIYFVVSVSFHLVFISFSVWSSSFVIHSAVTHILFLFTLHIANSIFVCFCFAVLCACLSYVFVFSVVLLTNKTDLRFVVCVCTFTSFFSSLSLSFFLIRRSPQFYVCVSRCACMYLRESLSINAVDFLKYFELFNIYTAVKRYLFYEKTSTRSDQTTARPLIRLRLNKTKIERRNIVIFFVLLIRIKHESLFVFYCSQLLLLYVIVWIKSVQFRFLSTSGRSISVFCIFLSKFNPRKNKTNLTGTRQERKIPKGWIALYCDWN